jgi:YidC/Oxa1 family membrane protein insertase
MDKKNQIIGIICVLCAFILLFRADIAKRENTASGVQPVKHSEIVENGKIVGNRNQTIGRGYEALPDDRKVVLENDLIRVEFTSNCGAIDRIFLKKYRKFQEKENLIAFNEGGDHPALALLIGADSGNMADYAYGFSVESVDGNAVVFKKLDGSGLEITRSYSLIDRDGKNSDAYIIKHRTNLANHSNAPMRVKNIGLSLGSMPAMEGDITGDYLNFGYYDGKSAEFIKSRDFAASRGFFGLGRRDSREYINGKKSISWGSIKNQFFTAILTPATRASGFITQPLLLNDADSTSQNEGISAEMLFKVGNIDSDCSYSLDLDFYAGPKDFARLDRMHERQDLVMQFGFFGIISKILLFVMLGIHSLVPNWGFAIILLTAIVKLCLWPLTTAQVRASKKMSAIQAPLREIKEKYKNNSSKIQAETMKLFKRYRVNPAAGCLPIFIQIPIFFGLYFMLRTSSELRFAHFLWIKDLSVADTVTSIMGFPINILPLIMCATMVIQMNVTPMPSADGSQKMIFKLMPIIFLFCCYNFPSGLVLYWTVQNILTIIQQCVVSRRRDMQIDQLLTADPTLEKVDKRRRKKGISK